MSARLAPVVAPWHARPRALIAPCALGAHAPEGFFDFLEGGALALCTPTYGEMVVEGATMDDTGAITAPHVLHRSITHKSGRTLSESTSWMHRRLADPGCPWAPHQMVAQEHRLQGNQSQMDPADQRRSATLACADISALYTKAATIHAQIRQAAQRQRTLAW